MDRAVSRYHVLVAEAIPGEVLSAMFEELRPHQPEVDGSLLVGEICSQEQLAGIVARLALLGYTVLEVRSTFDP